VEQPLTESHTTGSDREAGRAVRSPAETQDCTASAINGTAGGSRAAKFGAGWAVRAHCAAPSYAAEITGRIPAGRDSTLRSSAGSRALSLRTMFRG